MKPIVYIPAGLVVLFVILILIYSLSNSKPVEIIEPPAIILPPVTNTVRFAEMAPVLAVPIPQQLNFAGEEVPIGSLYVREYLDRDLIVNTYFHSSTLLMMKRANRWFPMIEHILAEYEIPDDFKYLALIESGLENVSSPAGARGYWQFLANTAHEYGLEVNSAIDERDNQEKATIAACKYLKNSYERFGNWTLVAAAYNAGNRRIAQELERQRVDSYYDLLLNQETARYVFRILAIKTIFENPDQYGFFLDKEFLYPPLVTEIITVNYTIKSLIDFAFEHGTNYKTLKLLNPWLKQEYLPNNSRKVYYVKIPIRVETTLQASGS